MPPTPQRLSHVHLLVADVERSARFYTEALGFELHYASAAGIVFLRSAAADTLALEAASRTHRPALHHVGFTVADEAGRRSIVRLAPGAGGRVVATGALAPGHAHAVLADPDGNLIRV
jgi:catechol 2,3-dioxygenase